MQREQLEHVLRAAAASALEESFVVTGSQAVLLRFPAYWPVDKFIAWARRRAAEASQP